MAFAQISTHALISALTRIRTPLLAFSLLHPPPPTSPSPHSISDAILNKCPGTHSKEKEKGIKILIFLKEFGFGSLATIF